MINVQNPWILAYKYGHISRAKNFLLESILSWTGLPLNSKNTLLLTLNVKLLRKCHGVRVHFC